MNNVPVKAYGGDYSNHVVLLVMYLSVFTSIPVYNSSRVKHGLLHLFIPYLFRHLTRSGYKLGI